MDTVWKVSELEAENQRNTLDFLRTDLALCFTFTDLAATELGMSEGEAAKQALANAEEGYATMNRFLPRVNEGPEKEAIESKLVELRAQLDCLLQQVRT